MSNPYQSPQAKLEGGDRRLFPEWDFKTLKKVRNNSSTIQTLGWLWIIGSVLNVAVGFIALVNAGSMALINLGIGAFAAFAAYGAIRRPYWGKTVGMILCCIALIGFPIGTIIGIMGLIAFSEKAPLFGPNKLSHKDICDEFKYRKRHKVN